MKKFYTILAVSILVVAGCGNDPQPEACFDYDHKMSFIDGPIGMIDSVQFTNCSTHAESYLWDFGDGTNSTQESPLHVYKQQMPAVVSLTAINGSNSDILIDTIWEWAIVYKPNIYLYPLFKTSLNVHLRFPKGGKIVASIPEYQNGWYITAKPNGSIDDIYDYLFYESSQPNIWQTNKGWCIAQENLESFFTNDMKTRGFALNEIADFIDFWIPLLNSSPFYKIYPQNKNLIDRVIEVDFSVKPLVFYRLFYALDPVDSYTEMIIPEIEKFERKGFTAVEWGVLLLE